MRLTVLIIALACGFAPGSAAAVEPADAYRADQLPSLRPGSTFSLVGSLIENIPGSRHRYVFADPSGTIELRIRPEVFHGRSLSPETGVRVRGIMEPSSRGEVAEVESLDFP